MNNNLYSINELLKQCLKNTNQASSKTLFFSCDPKQGREGTNDGSRQSYSNALRVILLIKVLVFWNFSEALFRSLRLGS